MMALTNRFGGGVITFVTPLSPEEALARLEAATLRPRRLQLGLGSSEIFGVFCGPRFRLETFVGRTAYRRKFYGQVERRNDGTLVSGAFRLPPVIRALLGTLVAIVWLALAASAAQERDVRPLLVAIGITAFGWATIYYQLAPSADGERAMSDFLNHTLESHGPPLER
jgi:hypothetical protein